MIRGCIICDAEFDGLVVPNAKTCSPACSHENAKRRTRIYCQGWRKRNPERVAAANKRWYNKNPKKVAAKNKRIRQKHPGRVAEYANVAKAVRLRAIPLRAFNGQDDAARQRNMDELHARTRSKSMGFSDLTTKAYRKSLRALYKQAALMRKTDGIVYHVDHKVPLSRGGEHHPDNMQILTGLLNQQKGDKMPKEKLQ